MKLSSIRSLAAVSLLIAACTPDAPPPADSVVSEQSSYVTGESVNVSGGYYMRP